MGKNTTALIARMTAVSAVMMLAGSANAGGWRRGPQKTFERIASFSVYTNNADIADETVAEIIDVTRDGRTLVYTDAEIEQIGFIDIRRPKNPMPLGTVALMGEPTAVSVAGKYALVGVNTSASFTNPSGVLAVVHIKRQQIVATLPLAGQPDSVKVSPDGRYAAVVIENERDEDLVVNGVEGGLPQLPAGLLQIIDLQGRPTHWRIRDVCLTGLAALGGSDPEPEFVDINDRNLAVVTLQENNHLVVVDLRSGQIVNDFGAGAVTLNGVDGTEDDVISLTETLTDVPREPDAVAWVGPYAFATANEGDFLGGSRGFSIFGVGGRIRFDSGVEFEELAVRHGHYPENRSENKGSEPESVEFGRYGRDDILFVGSERGSFIGVYELDRFRRPRFSQILPTCLGPEGLLAIPKRDLFVVSCEVDDPSFGVRATVVIYERTARKATYPQIRSANDASGKPIPWSALSGMVGTGHGNQLLAVWDSFYSESRIFTIDASRTPAVVTDALTITGGTGNFDPEGIAIAPDGTYWIASEGNGSGSRPNRLLQINASTGAVIAEIGLPTNIEACRSASANTGSLGGGFEGLAVVPGMHGYRVFVAQQRGWDYTTAGCEDLDDDATGANAGEPTQTRIWIYDPAAGTWDSIAWDLEPVPANASWVGLSEITLLPNGEFLLIERDNRTGDFAELKTVVKVDLLGDSDGRISRSEKEVLDILPALRATNGWVTDKPEGLAIGRRGSVFLVTDNDGVDDWSGETTFLKLGRYRRLFNMNGRRH